MLVKKNEKEALEKKHHFDLWDSDLNDFLVALGKYESKEETDRQAARKTGNKPGSAKLNRGSPLKDKKPDLAQSSLNRVAPGNSKALPIIPKVGVKRSKAEASMFEHLSKLAENS